MSQIRLPIYVVEAFSSGSFSGNPAAVVPLKSWLSDALMQSIAAQNNLSETAFFVATDGGFHIRWFTPTCEVSLCGHATLASAYVLFECLGYEGARISFESLSGELSVSRLDELGCDELSIDELNRDQSSADRSSADQPKLALNFPAQKPAICAAPAGLAQALGLINELSVLECFMGEDLVVVIESAAELAALQPNFAQLKTFNTRAVIVTAAAETQRSSDFVKTDSDISGSDLSHSHKLDFAARVFAPSLGIDEDPVTGSAYTKLAPIWAQKLGKHSLIARQLSARGGDVFCRLIGDRVQIAGGCRPYLTGEIEVSEP